MLRKLFLIIATLLLSIVLFFSKTIFQEGNPISILSGILRLSFTDEKLVKLSYNKNTFLSKNENWKVDIIELMKGKGYIFSDQMGSGYLFKKNNKVLIITHRNYSKLYGIWHFSDL